MSDEIKQEEEQISKYRLVIMNDDTFEEINSYRISKSNFFMLSGGFLFLTIFLLWALMALTPLKRILFGYGDHKLRTQLVNFRVNADSLQQALADKDFLILNLRKVLTGELEEGDGSFQIPNGAKIEKVNLPPNITKGIRSEEEKPIVAQKPEKAALKVPVNYTKEAGTNLSELYFTPPIKGYITADFQPSKKHYGIDIAAPKNTPVKSTLEGVVIHSDWTLETGNVIGIQHNGNLVSFYKHNSQLLKKVGSFVKAGEAVAIIGNTGELSDGPHLHFEMWHGGKAINPADFINF